ncbi:MAG: acylhydrolase [Candidatus Marinimicrobia bacterium]|nr:acylhydrolase [Candidatus Neomarinimicrobiota bacterium]
MKKSNLGTVLLFLSMLILANAQDWANLNRYSAENAMLKPPSKDAQRVVFMGNSITESWFKFHPEYFEDHRYQGRGISGQTTPQMLLRFRADVIDLKPTVVVILAGTNDIAGNTGPMSLEMIRDNIISMVELAQVNGIKVILASVLPAAEYPWKKGMDPVHKIPALNTLLKEYAAQTGITYLDYYRAMVDQQLGLKVGLTYDGVHPNRAGYDLMETLVEQALLKILTSH